MFFLDLSLSASYNISMLLNYIFPIKTLVRILVAGTAISKKLENLSLGLGFCPNLVWELGLPLPSPPFMTLFFLRYFSSEFDGRVEFIACLIKGSISASSPSQKGRK